MTMTRRPRTLAAILLAMALMAAVPAAADDKADAIALFKTGNKLREAKDYAGALVQYRAAYKLLPSFKIDFNIALTLAKMGRNPEAARAYERFLETGKGKSPKKMIRLAKKKLRRLKKKIAVVTVSCNVEGAVVKVDGKEVGKTPLAAGIYLEPGKHRVEVGKQSHEPFSRELKLRKGKRKTVLVTLKVIKPDKPEPVVAPPVQEKKPAAPIVQPPPVQEKKPAAPIVQQPPVQEKKPAPVKTPRVAAVRETPAEASPVAAPTAVDDGGDPQQVKKRRSKTIWAYTSLGVGLACAVTAGVLYGVGMSQGGDAHDKYMNSSDPDQIFDTRQEIYGADKLMTAGHVVMGLAAVAVGFSIYQFITRPASRASTSIGFAPTVGGATMFVGGRF